MGVRAPEADVSTVNRVRLSNMASDCGPVMPFDLPSRAFMCSLTTSQPCWSANCGDVW